MSYIYDFAIYMRFCRGLIYMNPQFRSIIPCEVLLYIEVTFWGFIH